MHAILTYHSIDASGSPISVDRECFRRHVRFMTSGRVRVVPLSEIERTHGDALALTFDDGFLNFAEQAWPLLQEQHLPATMFVVAGRAGESNDWGGKQQPGIPTLPLCDWDVLGRMAEQGLELGAHSRVHPHLEELSDSEQIEQIEGSGQDIERRTGQAPQSFCYPYGTFDTRARTCVKKHYARACTTALDVIGAETDPLCLPRLDAFYYRAPGRLEAWGTGAFRRHLWARRAARGLRGLLPA